MRGTLRSLPLLALVVLAFPAAPAQAAAGGSAACTVPFEIAQKQQLGEASFEKGPYKLTVLDSSTMTSKGPNSYATSLNNARA